VNQPIDQKLGWTKSPNSAYFLLQVATDSNFVTGFFNDTTTTDTSFIVKGLANNIKYYWRVKAANAVGISDYSAKWSFTTMVTIPNIPQLATPLDNAINQSVNISLKWNKTQRATSYQLQLATDSLFANLIINDSTLTDTLRLVSSLSNNVTYYWKVLAKDIAGLSNWSAIRKFTTIVQLPNQTILLSPESGATVTADSVACIWNQCAPEILNYWFERAADSLFTSNRIVDSTLVDTVIITRQLTNNKTFWWRVRASNIAGWGEFSVKRFFNAIITSVADQGNIPHVFALEQNYPNPFNPTTIIEYDVPKTVHVKIFVFDILGRQVKTLVDEEKSAGNYKVEFDANNFSSGVYFYRIETTEFTDTKKLILMK
jgi:hypothetical protein